MTKATYSILKISHLGVKNLQNVKKWINPTSFLILVWTRKPNAEVL